MLHESAKLDKSTRIVNGYPSKPRGWMALIRTIDLVKTKILETRAGECVTKCTSAFSEGRA